MRDMERFELLQESLRNFSDLGNIWIVAPDEEQAAMAALLPRATVISESEVVSRLNAYVFLRKLLYFRGIYPRHVPMKSRRFNITGWYIQQLIKIGIARFVESPFYLTLDADVVCIRRTHTTDLIRDGRAIVNTVAWKDHQDWYDQSSQVLELPPATRSYGVTPAILSRDGMLAMMEYLEGRHLGKWQDILIRKTPWTEYTLYHTFLEGAGLWNKYHIDGGQNAIYSVTTCLWLPDQKLDVQTALENDAYFIIAQSNTSVPIMQIRDHMIANEIPNISPTPSRKTQQ